jgi:Tol biopolymer transport system component
MHRRRFLRTACAGAFPPAVAVDVMAGALQRLTEPGRGDNRASYMPDGQSLLFASTRAGSSQIWTIQPDGTEARRLHLSLANDYGRVAPSPDGRLLSFSSDRNGENAVYVLHPESGAVTCISDAAHWSFGPCWSQHGLIAFFSRKGGNRLNIWSVRPDGQDARQLTDRLGESRQPWWSPDGTRLAFSTDGGTGAFRIWLAGADGSGAQEVTTGGGDWQQPFWSPDGRRIAVSARPEGERRFRILIADLDGHARAIRQPVDVHNVHPAWSPDGRSIVFTSGEGRAGALWRFDFA